MEQQSSKSKPRKKVQCSDYYVYKDWSGTPASSSDAAIIQIESGLHPSTRRFPFQLYDMLSDQAHSGIIEWMPHGRSWRIVDRPRFTREVLPKYFERVTNSNFFVTLVNIWRFRRIKSGDNKNTFFHELFLRGMPHLFVRMCPFKKKTPYELTVDCLNFYALTPLPTIDTGSESSAPAGDATSTSSSTFALALPKNDCVGTHHDTENAEGKNNRKTEPAKRNSSSMEPSINDRVQRQRENDTSPENIANDNNAPSNNNNAASPSLDRKPSAKRSIQPFSTSSCQLNDQAAAADFNSSAATLRIFCQQEQNNYSYISPTIRAESCASLGNMPLTARSSVIPTTTTDNRINSGNNNNANIAGISNQIKTLRQTEQDRIFCLQLSIDYYRTQLLEAQQRDNELANLELELQIQQAQLREGEFATNVISNFRGRLARMGVSSSAVSASTSSSFQRQMELIRDYTFQQHRHHRQQQQQIMGGQNANNNYTIGRNNNNNAGSFPPNVVSSAVTDRGRDTTRSNNDNASADDFGRDESKGPNSM